MFFDCELLLGYVEIIKVVLIDDVQLFDLFEKIGVQVFDSCVFVQVIVVVVVFKVWIVVEDEQECGCWVLFNFGYIFGYVFEVEVLKDVVCYGEVVVAGMVLVFDYLVYFGVCLAEDVQCVCVYLDDIGLFSVAGKFVYIQWDV